MGGSLILLVLVVVVALWMVGAYNGLVSLKNQTLNAFKQIDVQLKRRHDLIPNLVNAVRGAMDFEKSTLEAVIQARNQAVKVNAAGPEGIKQISQAENALPQALQRQLGRAAGRPVDEAEAVSGETALNLFQQQEANRRRTALLVIGFVVFFAWFGFGGDYIYHLYTLAEPPTAYHHTFPWFGIALSLVAAVMAWYAYATGPEKVLWSTGAREVVDATDPKERQLVNVVEEMAIAAGVPRPRIWLVDDPDPNAF